MKKWLSAILMSCILLVSQGVYASGEPIHVKIGPTSSSVQLKSDGGVLKNGASVGSAVDVTASRVSEGDVFSSPNGFLVVNGKPYRGSVRFQKRGSSLETINIVDVDDYIRGVLPKEIGTSTHIEALKTQAIVSRSFAYFNWNKFAKQGYNLDDTTASQAYAGMSVESKNTDRAVFETRGELLYYKGSVANTIFHATSGGRTESIEDVWGGNPVPYLKSMPDPYSIETNHSTWKATFKKSDFSRRFPEIGTPKAIRVIDRTQGGRIKTLELVGTSGSKKMTGNQFRMQMGPVTLKSTDFDTSPIDRPTGEEQPAVITASGTVPLGNQSIISSTGIVPFIRSTILTASGVKPFAGEKAAASASDYMVLGDSTTFYGRGYGHGVGLSQYGAINMAESGMGYKDILMFYFPGTYIQ
ncbi:MAG: SpoIID/LytB domain-containing protein [Peptoniphilus sp.]|nr:SpoIID/LytB domain-containing protein [Peptoniphilus sp.]MDD7363354.1 SpoIID/LytB domain-containing protein [Bacillota bacterium]MDY6044273.1 SpoIID/LytB domain-containing protein [Peptoniphilus sp.]